jgi:hypothetical protein
LTTAELKKRLREELKLPIGIADKAVTFLRRKTRNCFIVEALATITEAQKYKGVLMKLKGDLDDFERSFMPLIIQLPLDNLQAYECEGITFHHKGNRNCRTCLTKSEDFYPSNKSRSGIVSFDNMMCQPCGPPRGVSESYVLGMLLEKQLSKTVAERAGIPRRNGDILSSEGTLIESHRYEGVVLQGNKRQREVVGGDLGRRKDFNREADVDIDSQNKPAQCPISFLLADDIRMQRVTERAKLQGIFPMDNPLVKMLHMLVDAGVLNFHQAFPPDKLHTFDKSAVELAIRWSVAVIYLWSKNITSAKTDPQTRRNPIAALDERLKNFERWTAINPIGDIRAWLSDGISVLFSDSRTTKNALSKGAMTGGGLDAKKLGQYLFQLIMVIGTGGTIIPNERFEFSYKDASGDRRPFQVNPSEVVLGAMCRVFELQILCSGNSFALSDIAYIDSLLQESVVWMKMLWDLKQFLVDDYGRSPSVVKLHIYTHSPPLILSLGGPANTNTEVFERAHQEGVHQPSLRISNRGEDSHRELMKHSLVRRRVKLLNDVIREKKEGELAVQVDSGLALPSFVGNMKPSKDITSTGAPRKGLIELTWKSWQTSALASSSGSCWVVDTLSSDPPKSVSDIPLHPVLMPPPASSSQSSTGDRLFTLRFLDGYLSAFLENLVSVAADNDDHRSDVPDEKHPKAFYKWLIDETKKNKKQGLYRLYLSSSCSLKLSTERFDQPQGDDDDATESEEADYGDDEDDLLSLNDYSVAGSAIGGAFLGGRTDSRSKNNSAKQNGHFTLLATNKAKGSKDSPTCRRQFDFIEVEWTDDSSHETQVCFFLFAILFEPTRIY